MKKTIKKIGPQYLFLISFFVTLDASGQIVRQMRSMQPDTLCCRAVENIITYDKGNTLDSTFLKYIDTAFVHDSSITYSYKLFKKLLRKSHKKGLTAYLFKSFLNGTAVSKMQNDSLAYQWYKKKWVKDGFSRSDGFLKMCYSNYFKLDTKSNIGAIPIVNDVEFNIGDTLHAGLALGNKNRKGLCIPYSFELSRLVCDSLQLPVKFIPVKKGSTFADTAKSYTSLSMDTAGIYQLLLKTADDYLLIYARVGQLYGFVHCNGADLIIYGFSSENDIPPPYDIYILSNDTAFHSRTDSTGICAVTLSDFPDSLINSTVLIAKNGLIASIPVSPYIQDQRRKFASYLYCDRTWYRPGDTAHIGGMLKTFTNAAYFTNASIDSIGIKVTAPYSKFEQINTVAVDSMGHFFDSIIIAPNARLEQYTVSLNIPNKFKSLFPKDISTSFDVEKLKKPNCRVFIKTDKHSYNRDDTITLTIKGCYFLGAPVRYADVRVAFFNNSYIMDTIPKDPTHPRYIFSPGKKKQHESFKETALDKNGELKCKYPVSSFRKNGFVTIYAQMRAPDKRRYLNTKKIFIAPDGPLVNVYKDIKRKLNSYRVILSSFITDYKGYPCSTSVTCKLTREDSITQVIKMRTDSYGKAAFKFEDVPPGEYTATFTVYTKNGDSKQHIVMINLTGRRYRDNSDDKKNSRIITDKPRYKHGDTAYISIRKPPDAKNILITLDGINTKKYDIVKVTDAPVIYKIPLSYNLGSVLFFTASYYDLYDEEIHSFRKQIQLSPDSSLLLSATMSSPRKVEPGDQYTARIKITDRNGEPTKAQFSAAVVDEAVFTLQEEQDSGVLLSLLPDSYEYPCSSFADTFVTLPSNLSILEKLCKADLMNLKGNKISRKHIIPNFGAQQFFPAEILRPFLFHEIMRSGIGFGAAGGIDELVGSLMGGDGGDLVLRKRGSLRIPLPKFTKGGALYGGFGSVTRVRENFADQAFWQSVIATSDSGHASFDFCLPDNLTQWRVRLKGSDGKAYLLDYRDSINTSKPLMIQLQTPSYYFKGDSSIIHAIVHNYCGEKINTVVTLVQTDTSVVKIHGHQQKKLILSAEETAIVEWPISILKVDTCSFIASVDAGNHSDAEKREVIIKEYAQEVSVTRSLRINKSDTLKFSFPYKAIPERKSLSITFASDPIQSLIPNLQYLMEYPHGCVEQTMNRFLPNLYVAQTLKMQGVRNDKTEKIFHKHLSEGLNQLHRYQHSDGGWGWWKRDSTHPEMTALVVRGLHSALKVTSDNKSRKRIQAMLNKSKPCVISHIKQHRNGVKTQLSLLQSLVGSRELSKFKEKIISLSAAVDTLNLLQCAQLLECANFLSLKNTESTLINHLIKKAISKDNMNKWSFDYSTPHDYWYSSDIFVTARVLHAIACSKPDHQLIQPTIQWLLSKREGNKWVNTAATAEVIRAICLCFHEKTHKKESINALKIQINGKPYPITLGDNLKSHLLVQTFQVDQSYLREQNNELIFTNDKGKPVYCVARFNYLNKISTKIDSQRGIQVSRSYKKLDALSKLDTTNRYPLKGRCNSGDEIEVHLTISSPKNLHYILLEDYFPAGMEIINSSDKKPPEGIAHIEYHEDRVYMYINVLKAGKQSFRYKLRAIFPGVYKILPAKMEAMYAPGRSYVSNPHIMKIAQE